MKRERGQALILVLTLLAVGTLLIVPTLRITSDTLKSSQMYVQFANEDYAANAALEYGLWRLNYETDFAKSLTPGVESEPFSVTINGVTAWTTVTSYADIGGELSGQYLMKNAPYKVTKQVMPDTAEPGVETEFTYMVTLKCYDPDVPPLQEIIDYLQEGLEYVDGSTDWDEEQWGIPPFPPETKHKKDAGYELKWKFKDNAPLVDGVVFEYGEVKSMSFGVIGTLDEGIYGNEIYVKPGDKHMGAFQAPITVGEPDYNSVPGGWLDINKIANPPIVFAGEPITITYTVIAENVDIVPVKVKNIEDWLPSTGVSDKDSPNVFKYVDDSTSANITLGPPFWDYKMKLTFDNSASGEDLINFPVLIHLTSAHSDFWAHVNSSITTDDTKDLRFLDDDGETHLYFEAEKIDYFAKDALIWVKIPLIDAGSTTDFIYLYYGNVAARESNKHLVRKVWDTHYQGVWHLKESLTGASGEVKDSTGVNDGTGGPTNGTYTGPTGGASGQIDNAIDFDGSDDYVDLGDIIKSPSAITVAAWYKIDALPDAHMAMVNKGDNSYALKIAGEGGFANKIEFFIHDTMWREVFSNDVSPTGTFVYAAGTWDGTDVKLYVDGTLQAGSDTADSITPTTYALQLGNNSQQSGRNFDGILDEVRISSLARSADWIEAEYLSMTDALIAYGSEEENLGAYYSIEVPLPDTYPDAKNILEEKWKDKDAELRWSLKWNLENHEEARFDPIFLETGEILIMVFQSEVTLEYSGAYLNEFLVECIRYPFHVVKTVDDPKGGGGLWWPPNSTPHINVTVENIDVEEQKIKKLKAWLPGPDTGLEEDSFSYPPPSITGYITHTDSSETEVTIEEPELGSKENKWDNKKKRWKVVWDIKPDATLQPGEVLTVDFDTLVDPSEPKITTYSELLWEIEIAGEADLKRKLYSFPTAGVVVPTYHLDIDTLSSVLAANAQHGGGKIGTKSVHWKKHQ